MQSCFSAEKNIIIFLVFRLNLRKVIYFWIRLVVLFSDSIELIFAGFSFLEFIRFSCLDKSVLTTRRHWMMPLGRCVNSNLCSPIVLFIDLIAA